MYEKLAPVLSSPESNSTGVSMLVTVQGRLASQVTRVFANTTVADDTGHEMTAEYAWAVADGVVLDASPLCVAVLVGAVVCGNVVVPPLATMTSPMLDGFGTSLYG